MEILLPLLYLAFFVFLIFRLNFFGNFGLKRRTIAFLLLLKFASGMSLWAIYTYYYTQRNGGDTFKYFDDSLIIYKALHAAPMDFLRMVFMMDWDTDYFSKYYSQMNNWYGEFNSPFFNDAHTIIRLNALVRLFSFGIYHIHTLIWCCMSLMGSLYMYRAFVRHMTNFKKPLFVAIFLLPSVIFWSSGVLKEGPLFLGLGVFIYSYFRIWDKISTLKYAILIFLSLFLISMVKFYILFCMVPGVLADSWIRLGSGKKILIKYAFTYVLLSLSILLFSNILPFLNPLSFLVYKQTNFINFANGGVYLVKGETWIYVEDENRNILIPANGDNKFTIRNGSSYYFWPGQAIQDSVKILHSTDTSTYTLLLDVKPAKSKIEIEPLQANLWSLIKKTPNALLNSLFRPYPWEATNPLLFLSMAENVAFLAFIIICLFFIKSKIENLKLVLFCLSFSLLLCFLSGVVTPVLGAIVRYKAPALPFLYTALLLIVDTEKLKAKIPFLRK